MADISVVQVRDRNNVCLQEAYGIIIIIIIIIISFIYLMHILYHILYLHPKFLENPFKVLSSLFY